MFNIMSKNVEKVRAKLIADADFTMYAYGRYLCKRGQ